MSRFPSKSERRKTRQGSGPVDGIGSDPALSSGRLGFSVKEVAGLLGLSPDVIRDEVKQGKLEHKRFGSRIIIPRSALGAPEARSNVDVELLARTIRLQQLQADRRAIDIEIERLESEIQ